MCLFFVGLGETRIMASTTALPRCWVNSATIKHYLPDDSSDGAGNQRIRVANINGKEIAFFRGLTAQHNRSVLSFSKALGADWDDLDVVVSPILLKFNDGFISQYALFHGPRQEYILEMSAILATSPNYRPELLRSLCERLVDNTPLRAFFDIEHYVPSDDASKKDAERLVEKAFIGEFHKFFNKLLPLADRASRPWPSFQQGPFAVASATRTVDIDALQYHKVSFHVIVPRLFFKNRRLLERAMQAFSHQFPLKENKPGGDYKSIIDASVYGKGKAYRLPNTIKPGSPLSLLRVVTCDDDISKFFIVHPPGEGDILVETKDLEAIEAWTPLLQQARNREKPIVLREGETCDILDDVRTALCRMLGLPEEYSHEKQWRVRLVGDCLYFQRGYHLSGRSQLPSRRQPLQLGPRHQFEDLQNDPVLLWEAQR